MHRAPLRVAAAAVGLLLAGSGAAYATGHATPAQTTTTTTATTATSTTTTTSTTQTASIRTADRAFATKAAASDRFEIRSGQIAVARGMQPTRAVGRRLIHDHTRSSRLLKTIATHLKLTLPTTLPPSLQRQVKLLTTSRATMGFDLKFARMQVTAHQQAIALFTKEAKTGRNAMLRAFAKSQLPVLRMHLASAKGLAARA